MFDLVNAQLEVKQSPFANSVHEGDVDFHFEFANAKVAERLKGTNFDTQGQVFLLNFSYLVEFLGQRWDSKRPIIWEHLQSSFEKNFGKPNWCMVVNSTSWIFAMPTVPPRFAVQEAARIFQNTLQFFIGSETLPELDLFEVLVEPATRLTLRKVHRNIYENKEVPRPINIKTLEIEQKQTPKLLSHKVSEKFVNQSIGIRATIEGLFQIKNMTAIGHRVRCAVFDVANNQELNDKSIAALGIQERETIDKSIVEMGTEMFSQFSAEKRKILFCVPISFSSLNSVVTRNKIIGDLAGFAAQFGLKAVVEIHDLNNVPHFKIVEAISYFKGQNIAVVCDNINEANLVGQLKAARIDGFSVKFTRQKRTQLDMINYIKSLNHTSRNFGGFSYVYGFDNFNEAEIAKLAGFGHVAISLL